jgi:hypothetical protein
VEQLGAIQESFCNREFIKDTSYQTSIAVAHAVGQAELLKQLIDLNADDMEDQS